MAIRVPKYFDYPFSFFCRCFAANCHRIQSMLPIIFSYMFRMVNVDSIHNALHVRRISHHRIAKSLNAWQNIQFLAHLFQREVTVSPTFLQGVHQAPILTIHPDRHIVIQRQPPISNKLIIRPRLQQHVKQISEPSPVQSARSSSQFQLPHLRIKKPHQSVVTYPFGIRTTVFLFSFAESYMKHSKLNIAHSA